MQSLVFLLRFCFYDLQLKDFLVLEAEGLKWKGHKTKGVSVGDCMRKWVEVWFWDSCRGPLSLPLKNIEEESMQQFLSLMPLPARPFL